MIDYRFQGRLNYIPGGPLNVSSGVWPIPTDPATSPALWYKADAGTYKDTAGTTPATANNDVIALWQDQSGNGRDATQATGANRPVLKLDQVNGLPVIRFAGNQSLLVGDIDALDGLSGLSIFVAGYATGNNQIFISKHQSGTTGCWYVARVGGKRRFTTINASSGRVDLDAYPIPRGLYWMSFRYSSANSLVESWDRNGYYTSAAQTGNLKSGTYPVYIGSYFSATSWPLAGDIFEILVYDRALSDTEMDTTNEYLRWRMGQPSVSPLPDLDPVFDAFGYVGVSDADLRTTQGVATDGAGVFWGSGNTTNKMLYKFSRSGSTYTLTTSRDTSGDWPTGMTQINGIYYDGTKLYVGGNNYNTTPALGWVLEYDPDDLTLIDTHAVGAGWCEGGAIGPNGNFFVTYDNLNVCDEYDMSDWSLVASHPLSTGIGGVGLHGYQNCDWRGNYLFAMTHEGVTPLKCDVWLWHGAGFYYVQSLDPPNAQCTQGICIDPVDNTVMYWVERFHGGSFTDDHRIVESSIALL